MIKANVVHIYNEQAMKEMLRIWIVQSSNNGVAVYQITQNLQEFKREIMGSSECYALLFYTITLKLCYHILLNLILLFLFMCLFDDSLLQIWPFFICEAYQKLSTLMVIVHQVGRRQESPSIKKTNFFDGYNMS